MRTNGVYEAIAASLRDFGYADVTASMIEEVDKARRDEVTLPHGIVGMFAKRQLVEAVENGSLTA